MFQIHHYFIISDFRKEPFIEFFCELGGVVRMLCFAACSGHVFLKAPGTQPPKTRSICAYVSTNGLEINHGDGEGILCLGRAFIACVELEVAGTYSSKYAFLSRVLCAVSVQNIKHGCYTFSSSKSEPRLVARRTR